MLNMSRKYRFSVPILLIVVFALIFRFATSSYASTGIESELSFEGKIATTSTGVNLTNGTYNMEFKIYTGCTNNTGSGCTTAWTEDYLDTGTNVGGITFNGGTFQVNLGSICAFSGGSCETYTNTAINWNTYPLYLSIQIGNNLACTVSTTFTSNCSGDGVMSPYILLTSTPYSLNSGQLGGLTASQFGQVGSANTWSQMNIFQSATNAAGIFQVQNSVGANISDVGTANVSLNSNLISYSQFDSGSFSSGASGWQAVAPGTIAQNSTAVDAFRGSNSLALTTTASNGGAITNAFTGTVAAGTYNVSVYVMPSTAMNASALVFTGSTGSCSPAPEALSTTGFRQVNCSLTTTGNLTSLEISQNDGSARVIYLASVNLNSGTTATGVQGTLGTSYINGLIASPLQLQSYTNSEDAFDIFNAAGSYLLNVDTTDNTVAIGTQGAPGTALLAVGGSVGNFQVASSGQVTVTGATDAAGIFQVQNSVGAPILYVSTLANNLLTYPGFETGSFTNDTIGWQADSPATIVQNTNPADTYNGLYSMKLTTTASNGGAQTNAFTGTVAAGAYDVSLHIMPSSAMNSSAVTITLYDGTAHTCTPVEVEALSTTGFRELDCTVTTTANLQYLEISQTDSTARTIYIDAVQLTSGTTPAPYSIGSEQLRGTVTSPLNLEATSNSENAFNVFNSSGFALFNVDSTDALISIGSNSTTNTTQTLLQLATVNTFTEAATCATATNQGALYYNYASNNIRACINGSWQDLVSNSDLALQLFGVVPNSGPTPGDLLGTTDTATANTGSPCQVVFYNSVATDVYINACQAYSGGREINWPGGFIAAPTGVSTFQNVCFNTSGSPALEGSSSTTQGSQTFSNLTTTSAITTGQPLLCLATVETGTTSGNMSGGHIFDTRTFTTTTKEYAAMASATTGYLGSVVSPSTAGLDIVAPASTTTTKVVGVVVASSDTASTGKPNVIIATAGPQWIYAGTGLPVVDDLITPGGAAAGVALSTSATAADAYDQLGENLATAATASCATALYGTTDCQYDIFTNLTIQ